MKNAKVIFEKIFIYFLSLCILCTCLLVLYDLAKYTFYYIRTEDLLDKVENYNLEVKESIENLTEDLQPDNRTCVEKKVIYQSTNKTYMDYTAIDYQNSPQWRLIYEEKYFHITIDGYLMTDDGYYAVAMGSYFGDIGSKYIIITDKGNVIPVCKLDLKKDEHTDSTYHFMATQSNDVIEFIIDSTKMKDKVGANGLVYNGNFNNCSDFEGTIVRIIVVEEK